MPQIKTTPRRGKNRPAVSSFGKYFLTIVLLLALLNGMGGYWTYQLWIVAAGQQELSRLSQEYTDKQAAGLEQRLSDLGSKLRTFARREAAAKALREGNEAMLDTLGDELRKSLTEARAVRLFKEGSATFGGDHDPIIRFAELDMIKRGEKREIVFPEARQVDGEWRISLVEAVPFASTGEADTPVAGVLFVSVAANDLLSALGGGEPVPGSAQLLQQFQQQQPQVLLQLGEGGSGEAQEAKVANSYLVVRFTPSVMLADQVRANPIGFFAVFTAVLLASFALAYFLALALSRRTFHGKDQSERGTAPDKWPLGEADSRDDSLMDVEVAREDSELLGPSSAKRMRQEEALDKRDPEPPASKTTADIPADIFRSYDIRGVVRRQLNAANVVLIGQAIGSQALAAGESTLIVARDGRTHSPDVADQLIEGILTTGCSVINIGMVPTPILYFACHELEVSNSGVMVTASHNPPEYNGFKIVIDGNTLKDNEIQDLRRRILERDFNQGAGKEDFAGLTSQYLERIYSDVALAGEISLVIDAGNGVAGEIAPRLFEELGCKVTPLFCTVDGNFPNHPPDPSVAANLQALVAKVKETGADLGIALDGDADRVAVVTASGQIVPADRLLMLLAKDIVSRNPGADVLFDVKCSRELNKVVSSYGGRPIMWKAGHSHMKAKMKETGALLGGELSGHIFIKERWYGFDDGLYAAARVLEIMSLREQDLDSILENFPALPATPEIRVDVDESKKFAIVERLIQEGDFAQGRVTTLDGLRVDFPKSWGLVRASNTSAALTLRFEGEDETALEQVITQFKQQLLKIDPQLNLNF